MSVFVCRGRDEVEIPGEEPRTSESWGEFSKL